MRFFTIVATLAGLVSALPEPVPKAAGAAAAAAAEAEVPAHAILVRWAFPHGDYMNG